MKKRKTVSSLARQFAGGITILGLMTCATVFADAPKSKSKLTPTRITAPIMAAPKSENKKDDKYSISKGYIDFGNGWKLSTWGGVVYENMEDDSYWFHLSGTLRVDSTSFMGSYRDKQNDFQSGSLLRAAQVSFDGGIGNDFEYTLTVGFDNGLRRLVNGRTNVSQGSTFASIDSDSWLDYEGFKNVGLFVGYLSSWFGLDNSNSGSWRPFLEVSLPSDAFSPGPGLGAMVDFWNDCSQLTLVATQPGLGGTYFTSGGILSGGIPALNPRATLSDRWRFVARATIAPIHEKGNVWHFGISSAWREGITAVQGVPFTDPLMSFSARPSARARRMTILLDTGPAISNYWNMFNVEMARLCGPLLLEAEYTTAFLHRVSDPQGAVNFQGYNLQARYLLTGETHNYDVRDGNFGSVKPCSPCGAWEIAARYDYVNLNDKNLYGGSEHDFTIGLNWFINDNVRLSTNYVRASIHPAHNAVTTYNPVKRHLDILAFRAQVRFK